MADNAVSAARPDSGISTWATKQPVKYASRQGSSGRLKNRTVVPGSPFRDYRRLCGGVTQCRAWLFVTPRQIRVEARPTAADILDPESRIAAHNR
jgi:hypothetical protein